MRELILASASPRRARLLERLDIPFAVCPADADETLEDLPLAKAIARVAQRKAEACLIALGGSSAIIIAADTLVEASGRIMGKPTDLDAARAMVASLSGARHIVYSGVCLLDARDGRTACFTETTAVEFDEMNAADIAWIVEGDHPLDRAGGCDVEGRAGCFIKSIAGCYDNVMGLPLSRVRAVLAREFGVYPGQGG